MSVLFITATCLSRSETSLGQKLFKNAQKVVQNCVAVINRDLLLQYIKIHLAMSKILVQILIN